MENLFISVGEQRERKNKESIIDSFIDIEKSHVKAHERTSKKGKMFQVKEHEDKRQKKEVKVKFIDNVTDKENEFMENNKPNVSIKTGLDSSEGATKLDIYYTKDFTLVSLSGEEENSEPFKIRGKIKPEVIVKKYVKEMKEYDDEDLEKSQDNDFEVKDFIDINKSHVHAHTRHSKLGKLSNVEPFERKDKMRVLNIVERSKGNKYKEKRLAEVMANAITDYDKAIRRAKAAEDENFHDMAEVFYDRAKVLKREMYSNAIGDVRTRKKDEESYRKHPEEFDKQGIKEENNFDVKDLGRKETKEEKKEREELKWKKEEGTKKEEGSLIASDGENEYEIYSVGRNRYTIEINDTKHIMGTMDECKEFAQDFKTGKYEKDEEKYKNKIGLKNIKKEKDNLKKDYNTLLKQWDLSVGRNAFDIQGALEDFISTNNLSKEETKKFFEDRQKNKGLPIK